MPERILFVDDEPEILEGLKRGLRPMRHTWDSEFALGGEEALAALREHPFDAVVTDLQMPRIDGLELLAELQRVYPRIARIVLTGVSDRQTVSRARSLAHDYLVKPCNAEMLIGILKMRLVANRLAGEPDRSTLPTPPPQPSPKPTRAPLDLNKAIETVLAITRLEWTDVAEVATELAPDLPPVTCFGAELRLVILKLIVNAAHEIASASAGGAPGGTIRVRTRKSGYVAEVEIEDPATRISDETLALLSAPGATWTENSFLWLSVAQDVVRQDHGNLVIERLPERGTRFTISLPV